MGNKEILDYVRNTPGNTNPSVLKGMLNSAANGGGFGKIQKVATIVARSPSEKQLGSGHHEVISNPLYWDNDNNVYISSQEVPDYDFAIVTEVKGAVDSKIDVCGFSLIPLSMNKFTFQVTLRNNSQLEQNIAEELDLGTLEFYKMIYSNESTEATEEPVEATEDPISVNPGTGGLQPNPGTGGGNMF